MIPIKLRYSVHSSNKWITTIEGPCVHYHYLFFTPAAPKQPLPFGEIPDSYNPYYKLGSLRS